MPRKRSRKVAQAPEVPAAEPDPMEGVQRLPSLDGAATAMLREVLQDPKRRFAQVYELPHGALLIRVSRTPMEG